MVWLASIHGLAWRSLASPAIYLEVTGPGNKFKERAGKLVTYLQRSATKSHSIAPC